MGLLQKIFDKCEGIRASVDRSIVFDDDGVEHSKARTAAGIAIEVPVLTVATAAWLTAKAIKRPLDDGYDRPSF